MHFSILKTPVTRIFISIATLFCFQSSIQIKPLSPKTYTCFTVAFCSFTLSLFTTSGLAHEKNNALEQRHNLHIEIPAYLDHILKLSEMYIEASVNQIQRESKEVENVHLDHLKRQVLAKFHWQALLQAMHKNFDPMQQKTLINPLLSSSVFEPINTIILEQSSLEPLHEYHQKIIANPPNESRKKLIHTYDQLSYLSQWQSLLFFQIQEDIKRELKKPKYSSFRIANQTDLSKKAIQARIETYNSSLLLFYFKNTSTQEIITQLDELAKHRASLEQLNTIFSKVLSDRSQLNISLSEDY